MASSTFFAQQVVDSFVPVYFNGLRDLRNPRLSGYYVETPRSIPTAADVGERYAGIVSAAESVNPAIATTPLSRSEWLDLYTQRSGQRNFLTFLTRQGLAQTFIDDLETDEIDTQIALRSPELIDLTTQQVIRGSSPSVAYVQDILDRSENLENLAVDATQHFGDTEYPNDAFDADTGSARRVKQLTEYVVDLLGELS